jgi:hypothetical protein
MEFCDGQRWRWGRFSPGTSVSPANVHSICFSAIIFTITRGWLNKPRVAAVPIASQSRIKKNKKEYHQRKPAGGRKPENFLEFLEKFFSSSPFSFYSSSNLRI